MNGHPTGSESRTLPDEELFNAVRSGDGEAWRELVRRYERLVMSVPRGLGLSVEDSEEVFQATWRTLYEHIQSIRNPGRISFWIRTTARRESWRQGQKGARENLVELGSEQLSAIPSASSEPADALERVEANAEVIAGLDQMDSRCQQLLTRLFLDEPPSAYEALSAELGIPIGSIGPTRIRCLEKLALILGAKQEMGDSP